MKKFIVIVQDHEAKTFNVHGPMWSDEELTEAVAAAAQEGRNVNCTADRESATEEEAIRLAEKRGFKFTAEPIVGSWSG